jgi:N-acetylornithine carbamoyltransferase
MVASELYGKDLICTQDWSIEELEQVLQLAMEMKADRFSDRYTSLLRHKTFMMFFYNPSVRTRQSFEAAATELGAHAQFLEPKAMRLKTKHSAGETIEDAARVMSRYACGLGIRILEDKIEAYGEGDQLLRQYARHTSIPIINMADDKFHPCQGLADVMGLRQAFGSADLRGKKLLQIWGHGALARSWCSVQESLLINSRLGMDITLAHPPGYDLDPEVIAEVRSNCAAAGSAFEILHDPRAGYAGAHAVYSRNWMSPNAYDGGFQKEREVESALRYPDWICDQERMKMTDGGFFIHPMPVDRGHEVTDEVASGDRSIIYDVAENRLHVQKAVMALTMGA